MKTTKVIFNRSQYVFDTTQLTAKAIALMHDDVLLINVTTTPHSHTLFERFFHLP